MTVPVCNITIRVLLVLLFNIRLLLVLPVTIRVLLVFLVTIWVLIDLPVTIQVLLAFTVTLRLLFILPVTLWMLLAEFAGYPSSAPNLACYHLSFTSFTSYPSNATSWIFMLPFECYYFDMPVTISEQSAEFPCYPSRCHENFQPRLGIHSFMPIWPHLLVEIFSTFGYYIEPNFPNSCKLHNILWINFWEEFLLYSSWMKYFFCMHPV